MKIAITGHTRGIGKALAEYFKQSGHTVIGFSKSTGCDITQESHRNLIVDSLKTCDVFINNAYAYNAQKQLLIDAIEIWKDTKNTIVNIDSKSTLIEFPPAFIKEYVEDKNQSRIFFGRFLLRSVCEAKKEKTLSYSPLSRPASTSFIAGCFQ